MPVVLFIAVVLGIMFGTQFSWMWQLGAVISFYTIMESPPVRAMEIGAIIPMVIGFYFFGGVLIGDGSWLIQTWDSSSVEYTNPFYVNK